MFGSLVRVISPEDAALIEAVSNEAQSPDHWYNAVGIVARTDMDWDVPIPIREITALTEAAYS